MSLRLWPCKDMFIKRYLPDISIVCKMCSAIVKLETDTCS